MRPSGASLNEALSDGDTDATAVAAECECYEQPHVSVPELARVTGGPAASARFEYVETQSKHSQ